MIELKPLGDAGAVVCEGDVCYLPGADAASVGDAPTWTAATLHADAAARSTDTVTHDTTPAG